MSSQTTSSAGGFFYCEHCDHVVELPAEVDLIGNYKCPRCRHWTVRWRHPSPARLFRPVAVSVERGKELFEQLREVIAQS